jgi:hypothetical protein
MENILPRKSGAYALNDGIAADSSIENADWTMKFHNEAAHHASFA